MRDEGYELKIGKLRWDVGLGQDDMHFVWLSMAFSRILYTSRHVSHAKYTAQS